MKYMQAFLVEPHKFELREVDAEPKEDDVLIKISACGLCNWELNFWKGNLNYCGYPHPLGHEWAGIVEYAGSKITKFKKGDPVSGFVWGGGYLPFFGGFAQYKLVKEQSLQKLSDEVDPKYAMGEPQKCIMTVLRAARPESADVGLVLGCGPMGLWCIQGLTGSYLEKLIAVDIDDAKLAMAKKFGASHTINSSNTDVIAELNRLTDGHLADFVIEGTGIPALLNTAQNYIKKGRGRIVLMSSHSDAAKDFDFRIAIEKSVEFIVAHPDYALNEADDFRRAINLINNGTLKNRELVSHEFALADICTAFETLEHKPKDYIKGIVVCN
jgi:threonine dehydrogenase-like Zn-dependent dehydrogenase